MPKPVNRGELEAVMRRWVPEEGAAATVPEGRELTTAEVTEDPLDHEKIEGLRKIGG